MEEQFVWALVLLALFVVAFLLGSVPWGVVISRVFCKTDVRNAGSGNIGTTNAMRTLGKKVGVAVFLLDFGKGLLSGFLGWLAAGWLAQDGFTDPGFALAVVFLGCIWGHIFSPWLHFKGGKGIAVAIGCLFFTLGWQASVAEIALFAVLVIVARYVSIGSIAAAIVCPFITLYFYWGDWPSWILITIAACTIIWAHRGNIKRLAAGEENRIGGKK